MKYLLSETIHAQENGSRDTHFAKFLISDFLMGLTYSALSHSPKKITNMKWQSEEEVVVVEEEVTIKLLQRLSI